MKILKKSEEVKTASDATCKKLMDALNSDGRATMAAALFGNPCDFKPPGGTEPIKAAGRNCKWPDRMTVKEATDNGFIKAASSCGWGIYKTEDLDGGLGSIWYMEKDAESGEQFLVKQVDASGDIVRRLKAKLAAEEKCDKCHHDPCDCPSEEKGE